MTNATLPAPRISVIVPVFMAAQTIRDCLESLMRQTADPASFEVLLVMNGPDDGTEGIAREIAQQHPDHRIRFTSSGTTSAGAARNVGLDEAEGEYILFVDADDWLSDNFVAEMASAADPHRVAVAGLVDVSASGAINERTPITAVLDSCGARFAPLQRLVPVAVMNGCKLVPAAWFDGFRYDPALRSGEDAALNGAMLSPYSRRFAQADRQPHLAGARYFRRLTPNSLSRQSSGFDFNVTQRLDVIERLAQGGQADPADRAELTRSFIRANTMFIARHLAEHPGDAAIVFEEIRRRGLRGVSIPSLDRASPHPFSRLLGPRAPAPEERMVIVAGRAEACNDSHHAIEFLGTLGIPISLLIGTGGPLEPSLAGATRHVVASLIPPGGRDEPSRSTTGAPGWRARIKGAGLANRSAPVAGPSPVAEGTILPQDAEAVSILRDATRVIALDDEGQQLIDLACTPGHLVAQLPQLVVSLASRQRSLTAPQARMVAEVADRLRVGDHPEGAGPSPAEWALTAWVVLLRPGRVRSARQVLSAARHCSPEAVDTHGFRALALVADAMSGALPNDAPDILRATMQAADDARASGDAMRSAFLTSVTVQVLFHPDTRPAGGLPPVLGDATTWLAPLRASTTWQELESPIASAPSTRPPQASTEHILIFTEPGSGLEAEVASCLPADADLRTLDLSSLAPRFATNALSAQDVLDRLRRSEGWPAEPPTDVATALSRADVVVVDGLNQTAAMVSAWADSSCRVIIRCHEDDLHLPWQLLVDWGNVTALTLPHRPGIEHLRLLLGKRLEHVQVHTSPTRPAPATRVAAPTATHTLGMVDWASISRDPTWALEVLALLRRHDPAWHLVFIGSDVNQTGRALDRSRVAQFRARMVTPDVIDGVIFASGGSRQASGIGFALHAGSELFPPTGALGLVASGALPVFRRPPGHNDDGSGSVLDASWFVSTPHEATERILGVATEDVRVAMAREARDALEELSTARSVATWDDLLRS